MIESPQTKRRYFFDTNNGETFVRDEIGAELDGLKAVQDEAVRGLPDLARDALPDGTRREFLIEVRDDSGAKVLRATLSLAVERLV